MKNLSDFKKRLTVGANVETFNHNLSKSFGIRAIAEVNSNSFALNTQKDGETVRSWCEYPKAKNFEIIDKDTALIYWGEGIRRTPILTYRFI